MPPRSRGASPTRGVLGQGPLRTNLALLPGRAATSGGSPHRLAAQHGIGRSPAIELLRVAGRPTGSGHVGQGWQRGGHLQWRLGPASTRLQHASFAEALQTRWEALQWHGSRPAAYQLRHAKLAVAECPAHSALHSPPFDPRVTPSEQERETGGQGRRDGHRCCSRLLGAPRALLWLLGGLRARLAGAGGGWAHPTNLRRSCPRTARRLRAAPDSSRQSCSAAGMGRRPWRA